MLHSRWMQSGRVSARMQGCHDAARIACDVQRGRASHASSTKIDSANSSNAVAVTSFAPSLATRSAQRLGTITLAVAAPATSSSSSSSTDMPSLLKLELNPFITSQGMVLPPEMTCEDGSKAVAFVIAVFDGNQKLQYIGFSNDLRNTLRTLLGRRPEKAHYYKAYGFPILDQAAMVAVRDAWFQQIGGAPSGNKLQLERTLWQSPVDGGAISVRGKQGAAEETARGIIAALQLRGLTETFVPNPDLLTLGQVDFLPAEDVSAEHRAELIALQAAQAAATRSAHTIVDGQERQFHVRITHTLPTKGGYMLDAVVTMDNRDTKHRIIVGRQYVEGLGLVSPDAAVEAAMSVLLSTKQSRHTEGLMPVGQFPVNYFTVSEVEQWWENDFRDAFKVAAGRDLARDGLLGNNVAWRFTRRHSYGTGFIEDQERKVQQGLPMGGLGVRTSNFVYE